jgi:putative spermidine/putrescine transport system ATP-binding protein
MSFHNASGARELVIDRITHRYGNAFAVNDVTLNVDAGSLVALLGPSGCGKTTLLRIIAGFVEQTEGRVIVGGSAIDQLSPAQRAVGIVFQNYALFPHMTIAENVAYGLAARGASKDKQRETAQRMLDLVQLSKFADRYPRQLSGGQQQRVALARALAIEPSILLLDEPFAALDKNLRLDMQIEVKRLQQLSGITTILVTHDQEEALSMADRVAVLSQGQLEQFASPTAIYDEPETLFVNTFVGSANILNGTVLGIDGSLAAIEVDGGPRILARAPKPLKQGTRVSVCIRPEHLRFNSNGDSFEATVEMALPLGASIVHEVRTSSGHLIKAAEPRHGSSGLRRAGEKVRIGLAGPGLANAFAI